MRKFLVRRYVLFVIALFVNAFGIAFITKALLGTSPITSVTYVLSMFTSLTMGEWTVILNISFVLFELMLMTKADVREDLRIYLLQIPVSLCFGTFIDFSMSALSWLQPANYLLQLGTLAVGCVILAAGIALEVKVNVGMAAGEYFVKVISKRFKGDFGYVKLGFDIALVALSCTLSLVFMSGIKGVREGTVAAALAVGPIVHFISPYFRFLDKWIGDGKCAAGASRKVRPGHVVITIAREFGSGGHILGEMLSKSLGIRLYDREFITMAAKDSGIDEDFIRKNEQSIPSYWLKCIVSRNFGASLGRSLSPDDVLFLSESRIIQRLADEAPCIIIGRCADFVLKDNPGVVRVFCCSNPETACKRGVAEYGLPEDKALSEIRRVNRARVAHYEYYTGGKWGDPHHFDLIINTSLVSLDVACTLVKDLYVSRLKTIRHPLQAL